MMSSTQDKTNLSPNIQNMREHIEFIASGMDDYKDGRIELAYGDEKNIPRLAKTFAVAEIQQMVDFASQQNASGRNVYLVGSFLNPWASPDKRNSDIDFYACNSIWCDIDAPMTSAELKLKYAACPPALVVVTGRKPHLRTHLWWKLIEPINQGAELTAVLDGIIQTIGGDPATKNPVRLMRLAGSIAWPMKKDRVPEQVEINRTAHNKPVSIEQLVRSYPQQRPTATAAKKSGLFLSSFDNPSDTEITEMLAFLDAGCTRKEWLDIGMALHDAGYSFDLWNDWSMKCPAKYDAKAIIRDWNSFKTGGGISLGTLIQRAHDAGYMRASEKPEVHNVKPEVHNVKDGDKSSPPPELTPKPEPKFTGLIAETIADIIATSQLP